MPGVDDEVVVRARARVGTMLRDKYRIERLLGIGGMASVYAATHRNGRRVALKVLHPELSIRADMRTRFRREGQAANAVNHAGAVVVIDDDIAEDGSAFLVMELLEGKVIEELWEDSGRRLPPRMVLAIGRELCEVLEAAHHAGIVHRDLKPENLFLTSENRLKVLDFGLAHLRDATRPKETTTGMVFGTPAFMAPEQANGYTKQVDAQSDLWAVGATMFTLLSGMTVHEGKTAQHFVILAATKPARSLATVLPDAEPALVALIDRALAVDKTTRWSSAAAMREAIRATSLRLFGDSTPELTSPEELTRVGSLADPREVVQPPAGQTRKGEETITAPRSASPAPDTHPMSDGTSSAPTKPRRTLPDPIASVSPSPQGNGRALGLENLADETTLDNVEVEPETTTRQKRPPMIAASTGFTPTEPRPPTSLHPPHAPRCAGNRWFVCWIRRSPPRTPWRQRRRRATCGRSSDRHSESSPLRRPSP